MPIPLSDSVRVVERGKLVGESYGESAYTLYEVVQPEQHESAPCLLVWLHGQDMGHIPPCDIRTMQQRLGRHAFCFVPRNPEVAGNARRFLWGLGYTKAQNKNGLGFVFGTLDSAYLDCLTGAIRSVASKVAASHVIVCGYSMGGFGAYLLGSHAPDIYAAIVSIAGHGMGTLESQCEGYCAPQPESSTIFHQFLSMCAPKLAKVPLVLAVHAQRDAVSNFDDTEAIVRAIRAHAGCAEVVVVPDDMADSDLSRKRKSRLGHSYYNYALLHDTSEEVLYSRLRRVLAGAQVPAAVSSPREPPSLDSKPGPPSLDSQLTLSNGVQLLRACAQVRPCAERGTRELVAQAEERLRCHRQATSLQLIQRLKREHTLADDVELSLRMLAPEHLQHVLQSANRQLPAVLDKNEAVRALVAGVDGDVAQLVQGLLDADSGGAACASTHPGSGMPLAGQHEVGGGRVRQFVEECGLGERVELALRLLDPGFLAEILAGEQDVKAKLAQVSDPDKSMMWLISQLDPTVEVKVDASSAGTGNLTAELGQQGGGTFVESAAPHGAGHLQRERRSRSRSRASSLAGAA
mmetsp:Transcript_41353/g.95790  ORF Transcript_41353/g.95790 Transcript_41353/m.95790 type:complete len:576 (+) Transcript_41353:150-1877(+)